VVATYCVEARTFPSGLNAAAIVDLGAGNKGQYLADKCRSESASTLRFIFRDVSPENRLFTKKAHNKKPHPQEAVS
jgi:hypothetical protein